MTQSPNPSGVFSRSWGSSMIIESGTLFVPWTAFRSLDSALLASDVTLNWRGRLTGFDWFKI
jgi:hypothetical protein